MFIDGFILEEKINGEWVEAPEQSDNVNNTLCNETVLKRLRKGEVIELKHYELFSQYFRFARVVGFRDRP